MALLFFLALAGVPVWSQFCGIQSSCSSCLSVAGCVWSFNLCISSTAVLSCGLDATCINLLGQCPVLTSPVVYASTSLYPSVAPAILPPATIPTYSSLPYPVYSSASASIYSSPPAPLYAPSAIYPSASVGTPIYTPPIYPPTTYVGGYGGFYGGGYNYDNDQLFDVNGRPIYNTIRNNVVAGALSPIIPGLGPVVNTLNGVNLIRNAPDFVDDVVGGRGYNRNPARTFVRNGFYANQLGKFVPGIGGTLNAFNKFNLIASLF